MTSIGALHGRARVRRAGRRCCQLLIVLLLAMVVLKLEQLARINVATATNGSVRYGLAWLSLWFGLVATVLYVLGYAVGGMLVDGLGLRKLVGLSLVFWCGLVALGTTTDPLVYSLCAGLATNLLPGFILTASLAAVRMSMAARRRGPAIALLGIVAGYAWSPVYPFDLYQFVFGAMSAEDPTGWHYPMFALVTLGTSVAIVWLLAFPETDAAAGLDLRPTAGRSSTTALRDVTGLLGDPTVWGLAVILFCGMVVAAYALNQTWTFELLRQGAVERRVVVTILTVPIATLVFAGLSDWTFRATRSFVRARCPFIVGGFLVGGFAPLLAASLTRDNIPATFVAALGLGAMSVAQLLSVDLAPRRMAGTYIGVVLTLCSAPYTALRFVVAMRVLPYDCLPALVCVTAMVGAASSAILIPSMRPQDETRTGRDSLSRHF